MLRLGYSSSHAQSSIAEGTRPVLRFAREEIKNNFVFSYCNVFETPAMTPFEERGSDEQLLQSLSLWPGAPLSMGLTSTFKLEKQVFIGV